MLIRCKCSIEHLVQRKTHAYFFYTFMQSSHSLLCFSRSQILYVHTYSSYKFSSDSKMTRQQGATLLVKFHVEKVVFLHIPLSPTLHKCPHQCHRRLAKTKSAVRELWTRGICCVIRSQTSKVYCVPHIYRFPVKQKKKAWVSRASSVSAECPLDV